MGGTGGWEGISLYGNRMICHILTTTRCMSTVFQLGFKSQQKWSRVDFKGLNNWYGVAMWNTSITSLYDLWKMS